MDVFISDLVVDFDLVFVSEDLGGGLLDRSSQIGHTARIDPVDPE